MAYMIVSRKVPRLIIMLNEKVYRFTPQNIGVKDDGSANIVGVFVTKDEQLANKLFTKASRDLDLRMKRVAEADVPTFADNQPEESQPPDDEDMLIEDDGEIVELAEDEEEVEQRTNAKRKPTPKLPARKPVRKGRR